MARINFEAGARQRGAPCLASGQVPTHVGKNGGAQKGNCPVWGTKASLLRPTIFFSEQGEQNITEGLILHKQAGCWTGQWIGPQV